MEVNLEDLKLGLVPSVFDQSTLANFIFIFTLFCLSIRQTKSALKKWCLLPVGLLRSYRL